MGILLPSLAPLSGKGLGFDVPRMWETTVAVVGNDVGVLIVDVVDGVVEVSVPCSDSHGQLPIKVIFP